MPSAGIAAVLFGVTIAIVLYYFIGSTEEESWAYRAERTSNGSYSNEQHSNRDRIHLGICTICQEAFTTERLVTLKPCKHVFHKECITSWKNNANQQSCPNCRSKFI